MNAAGPGKSRAWLVRNFWLLSLLINLLLVFVVLVLLAVLLSR